MMNVDDSLNSNLDSHRHEKKLQKSLQSMKMVFTLCLDTLCECARQGFKVV